MKKLLLAAIIMIASLPLYSQRGYWYHSRFVELNYSEATKIYIQKRPTQLISSKDAFPEYLKHTLDTGSIVVGKGMLINKEKIFTDTTLYYSKIYSSAKNDTIIIIPRITLCLNDGFSIDSILERYRDVLFLRNIKYGMYSFDCGVSSSEEVLKIASDLHTNSIVDWCSPVLRGRLIVCNPLYSQQYYIKNNGSGYDLNVEPAWITSNLANITVAVVDQGVEHNHEDLANCVLSGYTIGNATGNGEPYDPGSGKLSHGTSCAGIIGAEDNNIGVKGIASGVKILPVNIFPQGGYVIPDPDDIACAIIWAGERSDVLNCSWSYDDDDPTIEYALNYVRTHGRNGKGVPVVVAAGNKYQFGDTVDVAFPASINGVIAVGAINKNGGVCHFSQGGPGLNVVAFGSENIVTTNRMHGLGFEENYDHYFGWTSAACAEVSGVIALMLSANSDLTESEIKEILYSTCYKLPGRTYDSIGWNKDVGYGLVDAAAAVVASLKISGPLVPLPSSLYSVDNLSSTASVAWSWEQSSSIPIIQDSTTGNGCHINNSSKEYINNNLVATIYKNNEAVGIVKKKIRSGANFSGTYKQEGGTLLTPNGPIIISPTPETAFADNASILIHREHKVTLKSPLFSTSTISVSGPTPSLSLTQNGDSITFFAPMTTQGAVYTFTGRNNAGYDVYRFTVTKLKDSLVPVFLGLTHANGILSLSFKNEADEVIDARDLQDYDVDIIVANVQTGKTVYHSSQKGVVRGISTKDWKAGIYCVQATIAGEQLSNKIIINQ